MRRLLVLASAALLALGVAVGVWAARNEDKPSACPTTTYLAEDSATPKVMTYHRRADCD
jgi:hypothetical protein